MARTRRTASPWLCTPRATARGAAAVRLVLLALAALARPAAAQPTDTRVAVEALRRYENVRLDAVRFRRLTIEDGLSQNAVFALLQDRQGFVWIGTKDGLNRYDGAAVTRFRHDPYDPSTLSSSYVTALVEGGGGRLWVGTEDGGLNRLDPASGAGEAARAGAAYARAAGEHLAATRQSGTPGRGASPALWVWASERREARVRDTLFSTRGGGGPEKATRRLDDRIGRAFERVGRVPSTRSAAERLSPHSRLLSARQTARVNQAMAVRLGATGMGIALSAVRSIGRGLGR